MLCLTLLFGIPIKYMLDLFTISFISLTLLSIFVYFHLLGTLWITSSSLSSSVLSLARPVFCQTYSFHFYCKHIFLLYDFYLCLSPSLRLHFYCFLSSIDTSSFSFIKNIINTVVLTSGNHRNLSLSIF